MSSTTGAERRRRAGGDVIDPAAWGVTPGYRDVAGDWHPTPPATVEAILAAMSAGAGGPDPSSAIVMRTGLPGPQLGAGRLVLEDGRSRHLGRTGVTGDIPLGYHRFEPVGGEPRTVISSPGRCPAPGSAWGFAAQLYAARSRSSWGFGDLSDLRLLAEWSRDLGAGFLIVNPLHAVTPGLPQEASPYYPGSRVFANPLYLAVGEVPGASQLAGVEELAALGRALNDRRLIDRDRVWELKSEALESLFAAGGEREGFDGYCAGRGPALDGFARFCALSERFGPRWRSWPPRYRHPASAGVARFASSRHGAARVRYHQWLQWLLDGQLSRAASAGAGLVQDLAVGVDPQGADAWLWQDAVADRVRIGAPPDGFNTRGQDWALPPFDPWRLRAGGYEPFIESIRAGFRHGAGLRIDHVMGLFRLYWIPDGVPASEGGYVRYPDEDLLDIVALEAHRAGSWVVGEDLGTVEDGVRRELEERRVLSCRVWWFEDRPPGEWPDMALASATTHDLPTIAGVLSGSDLDAQRRLGMVPNEESSATLHNKLDGVDGSGVEDVIAGVYADVASAPCALLSATLDDALAVEERPNMPGTTGGWPNWCLALPVPVEELFERGLPRVIAARLGRGGDP
ncbi:MAG: 4-alpha-glucanotransferase [Acidimicrobiales bacterium]